MNNVAWSNNSTSSKATYIDLGCGRGKVLLDALDLGVTTAVGVVHAREQSREERAQVERMVLRWCETLDACVRL